MKTHGTPQSLEELQQHPLIGFDKAPSVRRLPGFAAQLRREMFAFRCDSDVGQYAALRAGFGIGMCQIALGKRDRLVQVLPGNLNFPLGVWVVMHKDLKSSRRVRLIYDHLAQELSAYIATEA